LKEKATMKKSILLPFLILFFIGFGQTQKVEIFFDINVSTLTSSSIQKLESVVENGTKIKIQSVTAYTDYTGNDSINKALAKSRMEVVSDYLIERGFPISEMNFPGETYPKNAKRTKDLAHWRRVDIEYAIIKSEEILFNGIAINNSTQGTLEPIPLHIEFYNNSGTPKEYSIPEMEKLYDFLNSNKQVIIFIRGHVCCMDDYNISFLRAKTVNDYLIKRGIDPARLKFEGFSNSQPLVNPEVTPEDQQRNRRVDVIFTLR
jgi:outer membrane protein OmpA-like peptidoglycan-associated protein